MQFAVVSCVLSLRSSKGGETVGSMQSQFADVCVVSYELSLRFTKGGEIVGRGQSQFAVVSCVFCIVIPILIFRGKQSLFFG